MATVVTIGQWLKQKRCQRGWSQAYLGRRLNSDGNYVSRWERDVNAPSLEQFRAICLVLEVSANEALGLPERKRPIESRSADTIT